MKPNYLKGARMVMHFRSSELGTEGGEMNLVERMRAAGEGWEPALTKMATGMMLLEEGAAEIERLEKDCAELRSMVWDELWQACRVDDDTLDAMSLSSHEISAEYFGRIGWLETAMGRIWHLTEKGKAALRGEEAR